MKVVILTHPQISSFLKSWPSPKRSPTNVWPSPSPLNYCWYYLSLLNRCLRIVTYCHNALAKRWISLSLSHKTNLIFVPATLWTNVTFEFLSRSVSLSISILKENAAALTEVSCPNWERSVRKWQWKTCMWWTTEWEWDRINVNVEILKFGPLEWLKML